MPKHAIEQLSTTLQVPAQELEGLSTLSAAQLLQLNDLISVAKQKQRQTLNDAIEGGLNYVPAILRGAVKKIVRG